MVPGGRRERVLAVRGDPGTPEAPPRTLAV